MEWEESWKKFLCLLNTFNLVNGKLLFYLETTWENSKEELFSNSIAYLISIIVFHLGESSWVASSGNWQLRESQENGNDGNKRWEKIADYRSMIFIRFHRGKQLEVHNIKQNVTQAEIFI